MKRIYVAGPYSADNVTGVLGNMRRGMEVSEKLFALGYNPFCPWFDYQFALLDEHPKERYIERSMDWLTVSQAVVLVEGWENSKGCLREIAIAYLLDIPVFTYAGFLHARANPDEPMQPDEQGVIR